MHKPLFLTFLLLLLSFIAPAQITDHSVEQMMNRHVLTAEDVRYNIVSLLPGLYRDNKTDTINALINYYEKNYGNSAVLIYYEFLTDIKNRTFKEEIKNLYHVDTVLSIKMPDPQFYEQNIAAYLWGYKQGFSIGSSRYYSEDVRRAYSGYYYFLRDLAVQQMDIPHLSPVEKWLLVYFSNPDDTLYTALSHAEYYGSRLQRAWLESDRKNKMISGTNGSLLAGVFAPGGNASLLGAHPYLGVTLGGRKNKAMIDADISFRFLRTPNQYLTVGSDNNLYTTNYYFGGYIGIDGGYELWRRKKREIDVLGGVAWDGFDALPGSNNNSTNNSKEITSTINSLNVNIGLGYRLYIRERKTAKDHSLSYICFQARYNFLNYQNKGGTDMSGNAITFGIVYGAYHRKPKVNGVKVSSPKAK